MAEDRHVSYRVEIFVDLGDERLEFRPSAYFDDYAGATHFALRELHDVHRSITGDRPDFGLFWCELSSGHMREGRWCAEREEGEEIDSLYLDNGTGELTWSLAGLTRRRERACHSLPEADATVSGDQAVGLTEAGGGARPAPGPEHSVHVVLATESASGVDARYLGSYVSGACPTTLVDLGRIVALLRRHSAHATAGQTVYLYSRGTAVQLRLDENAPGAGPTLAELMMRTA